MTQEKLILKDVLFNQQKVEDLARNIQNVYSYFEKENYVNDTVNKFPELELKQRIHHMKDMLKKYLPDDYKTAVNIIIQSLPKELDPHKQDDDFGSFILSPYWEYVAEFWCNEQYLDFSLEAFEIFTRRFSMEFAIRPFLKKFPKETLKYVKKWSLSNNYHVRRFASEGIRPNLPWWWKVDLWIDITLKILDNLFTDHTQYVLRSVANNLNDITKLDSNKVIDKLLEWKKSWKQNEKNMLFLITHALRTQIKLWNPKALQLLGYYMPDIKISNFNIITHKVHLWEAVEFQFDISSNITQKLLINYKLFFVWANGKVSEKVFNISKKSLSKWENINITKKHPLKSMTTKKLYSWEHFIEVFINGESFWKKSFDFIVK